MKMLYQRILTIVLIVLLPHLGFGQYLKLYDFKAKTIEGVDFDFASLKGKKVMVVNTASECALTPQFKKLQELYDEYGGGDFEIIGFPCDDFGNQEPGENSTIYEFCQAKYNVSFQMMEKISIRSDSIHPVYRWLTQSSENGTLDAKVKWNFQKFLINEQGEVVDFVAPVISPKSKRILTWLNKKKK